MKIIDTHQHFWKYTPERDAWITDDMKVLQQDYFPPDLWTQLKENGVEGCVSVQADQSEEETLFLLNLAGQNDFVKGVVGWINLEDENIDERLEHYAAFKKLKGFRHILQGERQRDYMLRPHFMNGIRALKQHQFTYDILIYPDQLPYVKEFISHFPAQPFVIDHLAKPYIKKGEIAGWKKDMEAIAAYENVYCKISGFVTEGDWEHWRATDFTPYFDVIFQAFGPSRILFGSDWPVCLVAASYSQVLNTVKEYCHKLSQSEQEQVFYNNAVSFYKLNA